MGAGQRAVRGHTLTTASRGSGEAWAFSLGEGASPPPFLQDCGLHAPPQSTGTPRASAWGLRSSSPAGCPVLSGAGGQPGPRTPAMPWHWGVAPLCPFIAALHPASQPGLWSVR